MTAEVISYRLRSAVRDLAKALGFSLDRVEAIAGVIDVGDSCADLPTRLAEAGLDPASDACTRLATLVGGLVGFPRHLGQHVGGMVMTRTDLSDLVPIQPAAMDGRTIVQWDKNDLDELGILKVDCLALGMLTAIHRAFDLVKAAGGPDLTLATVPAEDPAVYEMISRADTVGVFQIESRAQMSMLPRLRPRCFYDLVIEVAIVRPGPIQGGMVHPYLERRALRERGELPPSPYPALDAALGRTLGVPIFQEQVMQVCMIAAGFSPGEADGLRRAMAAWKRKGGLEKFHDKLINGMQQRGYTPQFAASIYAQIQGFAEYGFPESHAASFALLAYASAWLKCHQPAAFLAALLNSQPMGFYSPSQLVQDARRHGVEVRPVDVCYSGWEATLERVDDGPPAVRLGMNRVRGLSQDSGWRIEEARAVRLFSSVCDLALRASLTAADMQVLAAADALRNLAGHRREALWKASVAAPGKGLLKSAIPESDPIQLLASSDIDQMASDYRTLGLTLGRHPLSFLRKQLFTKRFMTAEILRNYQQGQFARACGIVTVRQRPATAKGTIFVTLEDETGNINVVIWPSLIKRQRKELLNASLLGVYGIWQTENNVTHLVAKRLLDLSSLLGELETTSRNFI